MASIPITTITHQNELLKTAILKGWSDLFQNSEWTYGAEVRQFEASFAALTQTKYAVAVNSGTMALWATLQALELQSTDEVITTPLTFTATAAAILLAGGKPVFADIDPATGNLDCVATAAKITPRTKAILVVHLYGVPADMKAFQKLARQYNLILIEDASHAHGATIAGKSVGSFGTVGCFSLYPSKVLGAVGNAGIVVTNSARLAKKIRQVAHHGMVTQYQSEFLGANGLLDSVQAVALNRKLPFLSQWLKRRRAIAALYDAALQAMEQVGMPVVGQHQKSQEIQPSYYTYAIQVAHREKFRRWCEEHGIETRIYYPVPLHLQLAYASLGYRRGDFSVAEQFARRTISLPMYPELTDAEVKHVVETVQEFFQG